MSGNASERLDIFPGSRRGSTTPAGDDDRDLRVLAPAELIELVLDGGVRVTPVVDALAACGVASRCARVADAPQARAMAEAEAVRGWTFLTNHAHVLLVVRRDPHARLREIAHAFARSGGRRQRRPHVAPMIEPLAGPLR